MPAVDNASVRLARPHVHTGLTERLLGAGSVKPWSPSAVRGRRSEQNRRIACDCRHLQPRPGPSHHGLTEQLQWMRRWWNRYGSTRRDTVSQLATVRFHTSDIRGRGHGPPGAGRGQWARCALHIHCLASAGPSAGLLVGSMAFPPGITVERATRKGGGKGCPDPCPPLAFPVAHQRRKSRGRSLHRLPLPCGATTRRARGETRTRGRTALYRRGLGQSVPTHPQCGLPGTAWTTTARALPSERMALRVSKSCPP